MSSGGVSIHIGPGNIPLSNESRGLARWKMGYNILQLTWINQWQPLEKGNVFKYLTNGNIGKIWE